MPVSLRIYTTCRGIWLDKSELIKSGKRRIYSKGRFKIDVDMMHIYWDDQRILNKTGENYYLHTFQNLFFALTGEELKINK